MATPMTAAQIVAQLKKWGIKYKEVTVGGVSWKNHNRNSVGSWDQLNGFIWHHTGADVSNAASYAAGTLWSGISGLPGPLCQFSIGTDGTVYLVGWGRANHAGGGDPVVLTKVQNENYTGQLKPTKGNSNGVDGNRHFYGVEIQYSGSHKMTDAQYQAALKLSAAIIDFHGWTEKSCIAHGEWSSDKWDPGYASGKIMDMVKVRADIKATKAKGPGGTTTPTAPTPTTPKPETPVVDKPTPKTDIYKQVWDLDAATPPAGHATPENPSWAPMSILKGIYEKVDALQKEVAELKKRLGE
jgi:hypothetical protein